MGSLREMLRTKDPEGEPGKEPPLRETSEGQKVAMMIRRLGGCRRGSWATRARWDNRSRAGDTAQRIDSNANMVEAKEGETRNETEPIQNMPEESKITSCIMKATALAMDEV